ncbi:putative toxin-antitoxin system toxin component, PIN family [soil metagenome]
MPKRGNRIIIDTNLWISFLLTNDYSKLDSIFKDNLVVLLFSQELLDEFIVVAQSPKFKKYFSFNDLQNLILRLTEKAEFIEVKSVISICRDKKDNFILALAKDGHASHSLTGDKDLIILRKIGKTKIVAISDYLKN